MLNHFDDLFASDNINFHCKKPNEVKQQLNLVSRVCDSRPGKSSDIYSPVERYLSGDKQTFFICFWMYGIFLIWLHMLESKLINCFRNATLGFLDIIFSRGIVNNVETLLIFFFFHVCFLFSYMYKYIYIYTYWHFYLFLNFAYNFVFRRSSCTSLISQLLLTCK